MPYRGTKSCCYCKKYLLRYFIYTLQQQQKIKKRQKTDGRKKNRQQENRETTKIGSAKEELDPFPQWQQQGRSATADSAQRPNHSSKEVILVCIDVCMVTHIAGVWINRVRLPILLVVSLTGKMNISLYPFAPENLVSRDGFGSPVPRQPAHLHTQAGSGAYLRDSYRVPRRRPFIYLNRHTRSGESPEFIGSRKYCVPMVLIAESPPA